MNRHAALGLVAALAIALPTPSAGTVDGAWSMLEADSTEAPPAHREYAAIHDLQRGRYLIFGGLTYVGGQYTLLNQVWTLDLAGDPKWTLVDIAGTVPGERHSPQWGYDPARQRLLLFGGYGRHLPGDPYAFLNDVWELSLEGTPTWTELFPTGTAPTGRLAGAAVYDALRQRFVGFGGTAGLPCDTWQLDLSGEPAWSTLPPDAGRPRAGYGMTTIHDPIRDRMIIFGGSVSDDYFGVHNEVWELSLSGEPRWTQIFPAYQPPSPRRTLTSIYDPMRDRMVIYGGWDGTENGTDSFLGDTWSLNLDGIPQWTQLDPSGALPMGRDAMAAAYDPAHDRLVVFGGWSGEEFLGDTWFLSWGGSPEDAVVTGAAEADPSEARLAWDVTGATGPRAAVFRRQEGTPWTSVATVDADASGAVAWVDDSVTPGERYAYQLAVASQRGGTLGGEVWIDVPTTVGGPGPELAFALHSVIPNPVASRFAVSFALPDAAPARLDVFDVAGRRLFGREVGSLGAGAHQVVVDGAAGWPPGVAFVRLTRAGTSLSRRVVIGGAGD